MLSKIYFCLFCSQKFDTTDEHILKKHLISRHFDAKSNPLTEEWIDSLISYQTELNHCLSLEPKSLPKSSMCQSNNGKQKLLKGCGLCDRIIQCFKLDINLYDKRKNYCVCGEGKEVNKIVVICHQCKHLYHYPCVEPTDYSGEETSLYKCLKCKKKDFEISELSSESDLLQPIHVSHHFNYEPFVCKVVQTIDGRRVVCNETFFRHNFLKSHLKCEHKLTPNENQISNYYELHSIPKVQHLIDCTLEKLDQNNWSNQSVGQTSAQNKRKGPQISNLMTNKRIPTETSSSSFTTSSNRASGNGQTIMEWRYGHNSNDSLGPPPFIGPVTSHYQTNNIRSPPHLSPETSDPPVLVNESNFTERYSLNKSQIPLKRGRGRPKGSKSKTGGKSQNNSQSNGRKMITPNRYIADGNPQLKSRLSEKSRLSRPNISLSREQEKALKNKSNKTNGNKSVAHSHNTEDDGSDWDSDTEIFEKSRGSVHRRVFESSVKQNSQNNYTIAQGVSQQRNSFASTSSRSQSEEQSSHDLMLSQPGPSHRTSSVELQNSTPVASTSTQVMRSSTEQDWSCPPVQQTSEEEVELFYTDPEDSETNEEPTIECPPVLVTQLTRVEDNDSIETQTVVNPSPHIVLQTEPVVNQNNVLSDWLTHTKPKKFPYFPQINDEVVYIPYGHRLYIDSVRQLGLYRQTNPTKYVNSEYINEILFAKVKEIKFEKHSNVRLAKLTLNLIENKIETNRSFHVKFHDIDNVLDFIILRQNYENSLMRNWKIGDAFRAIIEDKWWFGEIHSYDLKESNLKTQFQSLRIVWGNGATDILSFWDLEPIVSEMPQNKNISIDVTDEDRSLFYISEVQEWPIIGKAEECKRIANGLTQVMELNEYKELMNVLDLSNTQYLDRVPYLINLSIVRSRLQNMFYRRHEAIKSEIKFFLSNAKILDPNGTKGVVTNAQIVVSVCLKFIDEKWAQNIEHIYKKVMENPNTLSKIKYYSCIRHNLNPNPNFINPLIESSCAQIFNFNESEPVVNILTPSTTRPIVNSIRRSNDSDFSVIEISDSDEDEDNDTSEQRVQEMVNQAEDYLVSPTAPDSPPMPILESIHMTKSKASLPSRPIVTVRAQPFDSVTQPSTPQTPDVFNRYFCIFCAEKFFDRNQAMDHYCNELKIQLKCSQCPQNLNFESYEQLMGHDSEHVKQIKSTINQKTYFNTKAWIENIIGFMESLLNPSSVQNEIHPKYGDSCIVCQRLNVLTPDSQPFYHKSVFVNNRISMKSTVTSEVEFAQHLKKHLKYEPLYNCTLCSVNKCDEVFTSSTVGENCCQHLKTVHELSIESAQDISVVTAFFGNNRIPAIDHIIPEAVNKFIVNCSDW